MILIHHINEEAAHNLAEIFATASVDQDGVFSWDIPSWVATIMLSVKDTE